jgi:hypothetical protein
MSGATLVSCATCAHFEGEPQVVERAIPGLRTLSSGFASVRDRDGLCTLRGRYLPARARCDDHATVKPSST